MGKWRQQHQFGLPSMYANPMAPSQQPVCLLPPPPPLLPRPGLRSCYNDQDDEQREYQEQQQLDEPLDYSMKSLARQQPLPSPPRRRRRCRRRRCRWAAARRRRKLHEVVAALAAHRLGNRRSNQQRRGTGSITDSEADAKAAYAADCIKSRLDGCGKRVHLFLGILLHFGMPPGPHGETFFDRVISFSDEHKNLSDSPTAYFMVLDSKLLALIWSKFKGNSSNEYSTLTRAIRSTRQKYRGIFESVKNPGKKLYKFGPVAVRAVQKSVPEQLLEFRY
uniref:ETS domain-containing protein n=1 Tax=Macrostomum lignano TaxID=282301 RepID=A0A1I8IHP0_9PLAT